MEHRRPLRLLAPLALSAALVLAACGDDDDSSDPPTTPAATAPADDPGATDDPPDAAPGGDAEIVISGFAFGDPLTVDVGTTVTVRNDDRDPHTWTSVDGVFDSGALSTGDTFSFTFDEAGDYDFFCSFHPAMTGTITVTG